MSITNVDTNQEAFNKMVAHLRAQNAKSIQDNHYCLYRGPDGMKCAVGCLIPDSEYSEDFENRSISELKQMDILPDSLKNTSYPLLQQMQEVHDSWDVSQWENGIDLTARMFNLEIPSVERATDGSA